MGLSVVSNRYEDIDCGSQSTDLLPAILWPHNGCTQPIEIIIFHIELCSFNTLSIIFDLQNNPDWKKVVYLRWFGVTHQKERYVLKARSFFTYPQNSRLFWVLLFVDLIDSCISKQNIMICLVFCTLRGGEI